MGNRHPRAGSKTQLSLDFGAPPLSAPRAALIDLARERQKRALALVPPPATGEGSFQDGCELEETAPSRAADAYRAAILQNPAHAEARINLGRLLHQMGRLQDAETQYRHALKSGPNPLASFNLAVVLEDLGRADEAIAAYQQTLAADPSSEDAYFNLARIYEKRGERAAALRALKTYRNLTKR